MAEQAMTGTHRKCGCEICIKHDDTAICDFCKVEWPCDAAIGRAALERIEDLTEGWQRGTGPGIDDFVSAVKALRAIRDEARAARGEQT